MQRRPETVAPISLMPDPRVLYPSAAHTRSYAGLLRGVRAGSRLLVLSGIAGSGKTTLLIRLQRELSPHWETVFLSYTALDFNEVLCFIGDRLGPGAEARDAPNKLETLAKRFRSLVTSGRRTLLLIDEAQNLRRETLAGIAQLSALESDVGLSIILAGQPALQRVLRGPSLRALNACIADQFQLEALEPQDVEGYVAHRLRTGGAGPTLSIGPQALERVTHYTHGNPRLINIVCGNALQLAVDCGSASIGTELVEQGAAMAAKGAQPAGRSAPLAVPRRVESAPFASELTAAASLGEDEMVTFSSQSRPGAQWVQRVKRRRDSLLARLPRSRTRVYEACRALRARPLAGLQTQPWIGASLAFVLAITLSFAWPIAQAPVLSSAGGGSSAYTAQSPHTNDVSILSDPVEPPAATRGADVASDLHRVSLGDEAPSVSRPAQPATPSSSRPEPVARPAEQLQAEIAALTTRRDSLRASLAALEAKTLAARNTLQTTQSELAAAEKEAEVRRGELAALRLERGELQARLASLREAGAAQEGALATLRAESVDSKQTLAARQRSASGPATTRGLGIPNANGTFAGIHRVKRGDTLSSIAADNATSVQALILWNRLSDPDTLFVGQRLLLRPARSASSVRDSIGNEPSMRTHAPRARSRTAIATSSPLSSQLLSAVKHSNTAAVRVSLARGAPADAVDGASKTALMHAADRGDTEIVDILLGAGAQPNLRDSSGETAVSFAAWSGYPEVASALLKAGANVDTRNAGGWSPLMYAAINGHDIVVARLLDAGAEVDLGNREDQTALSAAAWNGHVDVLARLLRAGAKVNTRSQDGLTPLMHAAVNGHTSSVTALLANAAQLNTPDPAGDTALIHAARNGHVGVVRALVAARADANITNREGETAKTEAAKNGHRQVVTLLQRSRS